MTWGIMMTRTYFGRQMETRMTLLMKCFALIALAGGADFPALSGI